MVKKDENNRDQNGKPKRDDAPVEQGAIDGASMPPVNDSVSENHEKEVQPNKLQAPHGLVKGLLSKDIKDLDRKKLVESHYVLKAPTKLVGEIFFAQGVADDQLCPGSKDLILFKIIGEAKDDPEKAELVFPVFSLMTQQEAVVLVADLRGLIQTDNLFEITLKAPDMEQGRK